MTDDDQYSPITLAPPVKYPKDPIELRAPRATGSYGGDGSWSFFLDLFHVAYEEHRVKRGLDAVRDGIPGARVEGMGEPMSGPRFSDLRSTMERMQQQQMDDRLELSMEMKEAGVGDRHDQGARDRWLREKWAMTTGGGGAAFIPQSGPPVFISSAFVTAARNAGVLPAVLPVGELPPSGETVQTAKLDSGASVAVQATEGTSDSSTDPVSSTVSGSVAMISGHVDLSLQALQRSDPHLGDVALASELGKALAEAVDIQIVNGSGSAGQTRGLLNVSGITANTVATASQLVVLPAVYKLLSDTSTAAGSPADTLLVAPRRHRWFQNDHDAAGLYGPAYTSVMDDVKVVQTPSMPSTLGAGTNEDRIIALCRDRASSIFMSPVRFSIMLDVLSGTLQARAQASCYLALVAREPKAVGVLSGAGLVSPTFS